MDHLQIQLLHCRYGWTAAQIATAINRAESYVSMVIKENNWTPAEIVESNVVVAEGPSSDPSAALIQELKDNEVHKQATLAPLVAVTEIALLSKLAEAIDNVDTTLEDVHVKLPNLVKAFKAMQQDSVVTKVASGDENNKPGIAIQVITQIV